MKAESMNKPFPEGRLIYLITRNINKFKEARRVLADYGIATAMLKIKTIEIQDERLENIAKIRAKDALKKCNLPLIVEDAGLFIKHLNGFPGPYSSYVYKTIGYEGILKLLEGVEDRDAHFKSAIAYISPKEDVKVFMGIVEGRIAKEARGESGFGFDPIFEPNGGGGKTFAEMTIDEKNKLSHRSKALKKFAQWYKQKCIR